MTARRVPTFELPCTPSRIAAGAVLRKGLSGAIPAHQTRLRSLRHFCTIAETMRLPSPHVPSAQLPTSLQERPVQHSANGIAESTCFAASTAKQKRRGQVRHLSKHVWFAPSDVPPSETFPPRWRVARMTLSAERLAFSCVDPKERSDRGLRQLQRPIRQQSACSAPRRCIFVAGGCMSPCTTLPVGHTSGARVVERSVTRADRHRTRAGLLVGARHVPKVGSSGVCRTARRTRSAAPESPCTKPSGHVAAPKWRSRLPGGCGPGYPGGHELGAH
jgi:hypothetical protein